MDQMAVSPAGPTEASASASLGPPTMVAKLTPTIARPRPIAGVPSQVGYVMLVLMPRLTAAMPAQRSSMLYERRNAAEQAEQVVHPAFRCVADLHTRIEFFTDRIATPTTKG